MVRRYVLKVDGWSKIEKIVLLKLYYICKRLLSLVMKLTLVKIFSGPKLGTQTKKLETMKKPKRITKID